MEALVTSKMSVEEVAKFFADDKFATGAGCELLECGEGYAKAQMRITKAHSNGMGNVMGGAIFTLADFAMAVASNIDNPPSVAVNNSIQFCSSCKGDTLFATAKVDKSGRSLGFYTVDVVDNTGRFIAKMTATCARLG